MNGRKILLFAVIVVLVSMMISAFAPMMGVRFQEQGPMLTEAQLVVIGLVASGVLWALRVLIARGVHLTKEAVATALYVISFSLAVGFTSLTFPGFPPYTDPPSFIGALLTWIGSLLALASPVAGMAYLIYNLLLKRVLDQMFPAAVKA